MQVLKKFSSPKERYLSVPDLNSSLVRSIEVFATKLVIKRTMLCVQNNSFSSVLYPAVYPIHFDESL